MVGLSIEFRMAQLYSVWLFLLVHVLVSRILRECNIDKDSEPHTSKRSGRNDKEDKSHLGRDIKEFKKPMQVYSFLLQLYPGTGFFIAVISRLWNLTTCSFKKSQTGCESISHIIENQSLP